MARLTMAALMNCGLAPMTVMTFVDTGKSEKDREKQ